MIILWTAKDAAAATGGETHQPWQATGVSIDSRSVTPGDVFIALKGPTHDGHNHVAAALTNGASAAMVERRPAGVAADAPLLYVTDTQSGLEALGRAGRSRFGGKVIGLTGSVGKTGTKEMLLHMLSRQAKTSATAGNLNNHIGAPLTLARLPADARFAVIELGMNHPGEIRPISRMSQPHVALITRIAPAHTAFFSSLDDVAAAKAEIFEGLEPGGTAIVNADDGYAAFLREAAINAGTDTVLTFGEAATADARLLRVDLQAGASEVHADILGNRLVYRLGTPGRHWAMNSLGALAAVAAIGADLGQAAATLHDLRPPVGRGATEQLDLPTGTITLIDESYNASPAAMMAAFQVLCRHQPTGDGRRIAVLGDMLELGEGSARAHAALGEALAELPVDAVYTAGPEMPALAAKLRPSQVAAHASNTAGLADRVVSELHGGDVVLVKGSLGIGMAHVIRALREAASGKEKADAV